MAETTADVRRDIEATRERMSDTLSMLEQKLNVVQLVKDHPWPALALAVGAGVLLSGSKADVKAAAATALATRGASSRMGTVLDDLVSQLVTGVHGAFQQRVESWVEEVKTAIGAPGGNARRTGASQPAYGFTAGTEGGASRAPVGNDRAPTNTGGFGSTQAANPTGNINLGRAD